MLNIGEKIRRVRTLRGLTQGQLGKLIGFNENTAYKRIMQYEVGYRVPKEDTIKKIASVLKINPLIISDPNHDTLEGMMYHLFEIEEDFKFKISIVKDINENGEEVEKAALVSDSEVFANIAKDWIEHRQKLDKGEITEDEYFEWKINWPNKL